MRQKEKEIKLRQSVGLGLLIFYGVGTMIGGGIYALIGKIADYAGYFTPLSFIVSGILALFTACSYAELSSRYPFSAGEAFYVNQAFRRKGLTSLIGLFVVLTGVVSSATLVVAINGFIQDIWPASSYLGILIITLSLGLVAMWGIGESLVVVAIITIIEFLALFYIFVIHAPDLSFPSFNTLSHSLIQLPVLSGVFFGSFLAIYALIGFEDMVNIAEEVKNVQRALPQAILISIGIATLLYVLVSWVSISIVEPKALAESLTPLATVISGQGVVAEGFLRMASILTGINGALVQVIMASRVIYGMANLGNLPLWASDVHPRTQTPIKATGLITVIILILSLFFPLVTLAEFTNVFILFVFAFVNLSLLLIKLKRGEEAQTGGWTFPLFIPVLGFLSCVLFLLVRLLSAF